MSLSAADLVWNRAAMDDGGPGPREGDTALAALLLVHGMVMNGGVSHVFVALTRKDVERGIEGYRYFGFTEVAELLERATGLDDDEREGLNGEYSLLIPRDQVLADAFETMFRECPGRFAAVLGR